MTPTNPLRKFALSPGPVCKFAQHRDLLLEKITLARKYLAHSKVFDEYIGCAKDELDDALDSKE